MATCCLCNKSGWFLGTNEEGLCKPCEMTWAIDLQQHGRIIEDSVKIIENSRNLSTKLSRIGVAIRSCQQLRRYEKRGVDTIVTPSSESIRKLERARTEIVDSAIQSELVKARTKSQNSTTPSGKVSPFTKVIDKIGALYQELDDISNLEKLEIEVRAEMDNAQLEAELEKAEKAEFKGQKKKALNSYFDALYCIRRDTIDDALQQNEVKKIEAKIRELGGEVPVS